MFLFNPGSIVSLFLAGVLAFVVAPRIALVSRIGALALRLAAVSLALSVGLEFGGPVLFNVFYSLHIPFEPMQTLPVLGRIFFWGFLAWAVLGTVQSLPAKGPTS
jgi:hypothetical protein